MSNLQTEIDITAAIWGAIAGGVTGPLVTFVIDTIRRNNGKLILFTNTSKIKFQKRDGYGGFEEVLNLESAESFVLEIDIDIYNQSDMPKTLGNFRIEIINKNGKILKPIQVYKRSSTGVTSHEHFKTQTIFPKQSGSIVSGFWVEQKDFAAYDPIPNVYLLADYPDKRVFRVKVL